MNHKENFKRIVNSILDVRKLVIRIFFILWAIIILALVLKYTIGLWYPIIVEVDWFIKMCNFIDNHNILRYSIMFMFYILSLNIWFLTSASLKKYTNKKLLLLVNGLIVFSFIIKIFNNTLGCIFELPYLIGIPIFLNIRNKVYCKPKRKWLNIGLPIIIYVLFNLWQMNIGLVRDCFEIFTFLPTLIAYVVQIDYYAILINTWIGVSYMGLFSGGWLFATDLVGLKADLEKELAKANPDKEYIKELEKRIAEIEKAEDK